MKSGTPQDDDPPRPNEAWASFFMLDWEFTREPAAADAHAIRDGVLRRGRRLAAEGNVCPLACLVRREGSLIAGALGRTEYDRLFVDSLWVSREHRGQGLGSAVLERMEAEALRCGCNSAMIETLDDKVAALYRRRGYRTLALVREYVGPFNRHIMLKTLATQPPGNGDRG